MAAPLSNSNSKSPLEFSCSNLTPVYPIIQSHAEKHNPLNWDKLKEWSSSLNLPLESNSKEGESLIAEINEECKKQSKDFNKIADLIGRTIYQIEHKTQPCKSHNREVALFISHYISSFFGYNPLVFNQDELQKKYPEAIKSEEATIALVKEKMREVYIDPFGNKYHLQERYPRAGLYFCEEQKTWHTAHW